MNAISAIAFDDEKALANLGAACSDRPAAAVVLVWWEGHCARSCDMKLMAYVLHGRRA